LWLRVRLYGWRSAPWRNLEIHNLYCPEDRNADPGEFFKIIASFRGIVSKTGKKQAEVLFFNPMMLSWYIPNTPNHEHNNAPGAPANSYFHLSLLENGYRERARECAMYLDLGHFVMPVDLGKKEKAAEEKGYEVTLFDKSRHSGVSEMLRGFDNQLWQREIADCTENGIPVVIAAQCGKAVGFAGPVIHQENGRGYFTGIGVHPEHEGHGLGSILFFKLCEAFKNIKTDYMSLYTGIGNPTIKIYTRAGFVPVREFVVMRKEFVE